MNLYFELHYAHTEKREYWAQHNVKIYNGVEIQYNYPYASLASRIWLEDKKGVRYFKNLFEDLHDTHGVCDMEEFIWVKLSAKLLS